MRHLPAYLLKKGRNKDIPGHWDSLGSLDIFWDTMTDAAIISIDDDGLVSGWNPKAATLLGYSLVQAMGRHLTDFIAGEDHKLVNRLHRLHLRRSLTKRDYSKRFEIRALRCDGSVFPLEFVLLAALQSHSCSSRIRLFDVTNRKLSNTVFEAHGAMVIADANGVILRVNQRYSAITGYSAAELLGQQVGYLKSGHHGNAFYEAMRRDINQNGSWHGEISNQRKNGEAYSAWLDVTAVEPTSGKATHYVGALTDLSLRKAAEAEIQHLAFYDSITGLPNRRLFIDRLTHALAGIVRLQRNGALLFIDLDNFKALNDTYGHYQGDLLLVLVAKRLTACIREGDTLARLGGDEFVVMLQDLSDNLTEAAARAESKGEKILSALRKPYKLDELTHHCSASLGATLFNSSNDSVDELLKRADMALYKAKNDGRNTLRFYDPAMQAVMNARAELEEDLRLGLEEKQFVLYYQPQVDELCRLMGVEALVRWQHPVRGMLLPADFISLTEETGLIVPLGQWVLETACLQLRDWASQPETQHLTIAVNVSAIEFLRSDFVKDVLFTLDNTGAPACRLKLELTESLLVTDMEDIIAKMQSLKTRGVGFSLDDFGTGYSSLSYLKRLPLDQLKIDQSFLHDALTQPKDAAIVRAIVTLGQSLGMLVIAEGVETLAQRDFLRDEGCNNFQGFYFGRPAPVEALASFSTSFLGVDCR